MPDQVSYDEQELLLLIAEGDQKAFTQLVDLYWKKVYGHALAYVKSVPRAQEITQDIFLNVWNKRERLKEVRDFKNFLFILGRNQIISSMRKKLEELTDNDFLKVAQNVSLPDEQLQYKETQHIILEAIEQLPPARKIIFKMSRIEGLSYEEISIKMNISKNTVKGHIVLALNFVRTYITTHGDILPLLFILPFLKK